MLRLVPARGMIGCSDATRPDAELRAVPKHPSKRASRIRLCRCLQDLSLEHSPKIYLKSSVTSENVVLVQN